MNKTVQVKQNIIIGWALVGSKTNISMKPYDHLESEKIKIEKKRHFLLITKCLCENGGLHPMIVRKGKYIPGNVHNWMKEIFIKNWKSMSLLGLYSTEDIPKFTDHDKTKRNIRYNICIRELCHYMSKKLSYWNNYIF